MLIFKGNVSRRLSSVLVSILFSCLVAWGPSVASAEGEMTKECVAFRANANANIGEIMRAGCEPTLGQMSKLMDNPIGNVAMWINQVDVFDLTNDEISKSRDETQVNYMGIIQVPTSISKNWSIIQRVVYSAPSFPMSQNKDRRRRLSFTLTAAGWRRTGSASIVGSAPAHRPL